MLSDFSYFLIVVLLRSSNSHLMHSQRPDTNPKGGPREDVPTEITH